MPFDMMRVALGFAVMTIGAFGAMARPAHATRATETGSTRRRARRFGSRFVPARAWALLRTPVGLRDGVERRVRELVAEQRERSTSRPWPVKVRVVAPGHQAASVERAGALTPYAVQMISEAAARAGRGAQLEVTTPASADDAVKEGASRGWQASRRAQ